MENQLQTPDVDCPPPDKKRVLVVEDYEDIRTVLHGILQQMGYEVVSCANGTEAIKTFLDDFRCCTDVGLLMDLSLPDINGLRVMSAIREIEKGSTLTCTPIRMGIITAQGHIVEGTDTYQSIGVTLRVDKPFMGEDLEKQIEAWLNSPPPQLYRLPQRLLAAAH